MTRRVPTSRDINEPTRELDNDKLRRQNARNNGMEQMRRAAKGSRLKRYKMNE
jgi:hypothetical protein